MADYEEKFTQLSHYADFLVATERDKCRRFEEGLRYDIRTKITPVDLESFTRLRAAVIWIERLRVEGPTVPKRERERYSGSGRG